MTANTNSPNDTATHKRQLLDHLMTGARITPLEALQRFNCLSCSQRMDDLRRDNGIPIQSQFITTPTGKRVKEYWLEPSYINRPNPAKQHRGRAMNTPNPNNNTSHKTLLLAHLMTGATITPLEALQRFNCLSCSQRLGDLRREGIPVKSRTITTPTGKRISQYWLEPSYIESITNGGKE